MAKSSIPKRAPIADLYSGLVVQVGDAQVLAFASQPDTKVIASGQFIVRYGLRFEGKLHVSIVPGMVVLDRGEILTGEEAWDFLLNHSNLHPRAEIIGYRNDGRDDTVYLKTLDLAVKPEVLIYADETATMPLAKPSAMIASELASLPPRLVEYLPYYPTLSDWQMENSYD